MYNDTPFGSILKIIPRGLFDSVKNSPAEDAELIT